MSKAVPSNLSKYHKPYNWSKIKFANAEIEDTENTLFSYPMNLAFKQLSFSDNPIRIATVFSGIGAPEEALRQLNIKNEIVFACDIEPKARLAYQTLHGQVENFYTDIKEMTKRDEKGQSISMTYRDKVDLFVGGSPCPSFSGLGKKGGFEDMRGQLFFDYIQMVKDIQPTIFIFENVTGFINEKVFPIAKKEFIDLQSDYDYMLSQDDLRFWDGKENILNSKYYGLPQSRNRFYLVGVLKKKKKENFPITPPPKIELTKTIDSYLEKNTIEIKTPAGIYYSFRFIGYTSIFLEEHLKTKGFYIQCQVKHQQNNLIGTFYLKKITDLTIPHKIKIWKKKKDYYFYVPLEDQDSVELENSDSFFYAVLCSLTIDDCYHLMGFEQTIIDKTPYNKDDLYGQAGNSMAVDVLKAIYKHIDLPQYANS